MNYILETERLRLRAFTLDDAAFIIELVNSPGWLKNIGDRNIKTNDKAREYLQNGPLKSYAENGFGLSMVELKSDGTPVGMCGIIKRVALEHADIGFAFLSQYMGKGYAYEIASAVLSFAKSELQFAVICAITIPSNTPSIKLLEKIGLKFKKMFSFPGTEEELMLFSNQ